MAVPATLLLAVAASSIYAMPVTIGSERPGPMSSEVMFLLKITVAPVLVAVITLIGRAWGPTAAALIMSLPWMTGPVLFVLSYDKGTAWAASACVGIVLGVVGIAVWVAAYITAGQRLGWIASYAIAFLAYAAAGALTAGLPVTLEAAAALAVVAHLGGYLATRPPELTGLTRTIPWWDIPARVLATLLLVTIIAFTADVLGPKLSGIVATYPVVMSVVSAFTHKQWGPEMLRALLRTLFLSMISFTAFFLAIGWTIVPLGTVMAFVLATLASLTMSACTVTVMRTLARR